MPHFVHKKEKDQRFLGENASTHIKSDNRIPDSAEIVKRFFASYQGGKFYIVIGQSDKRCPAVLLYQGSIPSAPRRKERQEAI